MKATTKHDFHPDAESLSAFAEQALGARERGQVLAHLALCGRCRQAVVLAQEAGLDAEVAAAHVSQRSPRVDFRFINLRFALRFAWIPAAALAATIALAVFVHMRHVEQNAEMAKNERQGVTQSAPTPAAPAQQARAKAAPPAAAESTRSPARSYKREPSATAPNPPSQEPVATAAMPAQSGGNEPIEASREEPASASSATEQGLAGGGFTAGGTMATYTPEPAVTALQQEQRQKVGSGAERNHLYAARAPAPASVHGTDGGAARGSTEQVAVSAPQLETRSAPAPRFALQSRPQAATNYAGAVRAIHLPSGVPAVSVASADQRTLALDQAGTLFLSVDSGETWELVTQQWTGRAVVVRTRTANNASAPPSAAATSGNISGDTGAAPLPAAFFEILNDKNHVWLSTDGKVWITK